MLQLDNVTKQYGSYTAVNGLSFCVSKGQVLGFLGRNGAGKSTVMNMISGYLAPTSGRILWNGKDTLALGPEFLAEVGYLPEIPPLYPEMTVKEMLYFVCGLKKVKRSARRTHVDDIIELTRLGEYRNVLIRNLSKGYRQRTGLASALIGNPGLLLLDEPTVGLDPEQLAAFRSLILALKPDHAIIISSHILSEIESMCSHLAIVRGGRLAAFGTAEDIIHAGDAEIRLSVRTSSGMKRAFEALDSVTRADEAPASTDGLSDYTLFCRDDATDEVVGIIMARNLPLKRICRAEDTLESVFLRLTVQEDTQCGM